MNSLSLSLPLSLSLSAATPYKDYKIQHLSLSYKK